MRAARNTNMPRQPAAPVARRLAAVLFVALLAVGTAARADNPVRLPAIDSVEDAPPSAPAFSTPAARPARLPAAEVDLAAKLRQRGDLTLTDTTLRQALFTISESWNINLVVGEDVAGQVNGAFKNAPLHEILHSILYANGYGYRVVGQGLVVMKAHSLGDANPLFETQAIPLAVLKPEDVIEGAKLLASQQGKVLAIPSARSIMVVDLPERIAVIRKFVQEVDRSAAGGVGAEPIDQQRRVVQFTPQFIKAPSLKESLDAVMSKDGKAVVVEPENKVVVVDYGLNLELAQRVVRDLDQPRPQVRITAMIYDVSLEDLERLGINWNHALKARNLDAAGNPEAFWAIDSLTQVPVAAGTPAGTMTFMNLSRNFDISATIEALCQSKDSQLLADPSVTVIDREPATIQIVTEIPYQQLTQTQQGGNIGTTAFREAGVMLKVVPHIASDGTVQMEVTPTFSRLTAFTNGQNPQPIIDKRETNTTVRVIDRHWLVIGGLRQRTAVKDNRAIPGLSNIKGLGKLFKAHDYSFRESELIVFLQPELVTPSYPGREREQHVIAASEAMLDETPVAPHILGPGEVGCSLCCQKNCTCSSATTFWKNPHNRDGAATESAPPRAPQAPHMERPSIKRLPNVASESSPAPTPRLPLARRTESKPTEPAGTSQAVAAAKSPPDKKAKPAAKSTSWWKPFW